jgi:predicted amidohydrolase YtcJ
VRRFKFATETATVIRAGHKLGRQMRPHVTSEAGVDIVLDRVMIVDAAYLHFDEGVKRTLETGNRGDLAVLSDDYLTCVESRIPPIRVQLLTSVYRMSPWRPPEATESRLRVAPPGAFTMQT